MKKETKIELLRKARNLLHNKKQVNNLDATVAHDLIDIVLDDMILNDRSKNLKLYHIAVCYGTCVVAAEDEADVLNIISRDDNLSREYEGYSVRDILDFVREIEGYTVKGKSGIISFFQE